MIIFFITDEQMTPGTVLLHPVEVLRGVDGRDIYSPEVSDLHLVSFFRPPFSFDQLLRTTNPITDIVYQSK